MDIITEWNDEEFGDVIQKSIEAGREDDEQRRQSREILEARKRKTGVYKKKNIIELDRSNISTATGTFGTDIVKNKVEPATSEQTLEYPNSAVSWRAVGDEALTKMFQGEADNLLYQVKNHKQFNNVDTLRGVRYYNDGTVIEVKSVFNQDIVTIDVSKSTMVGNDIFGVCVLTLINVPAIVAPMMHPQHIHVYGDEGTEGSGLGIGWSGKFGADDVEGVGYIKTYYTLESRCISCTPIDFTVCDTNEMYFGFGQGGNCKPYFYTTPVRPSYQGDLDHPGNPLDPPNPENHCIYSFSSCNGEIIQRGQDDGGTYIIWKAYTEWSVVSLDPVVFSRTGLGHMKLRAFLKNSKGEEVCFAENIIQVDCCQKPADERQLILYWESLDLPTCVGQDIFAYGTINFCEVPEHINSWYLWRLAIFYYAGFWVLPELKGNCLPITWTLSGPGTLNSSVFGMASWIPPVDAADMGCTPIIITATDRCGTTDHVIADCCESGGCSEIELIYTSLVMACNQQQDIVATCGCPPFTWTLTGGGTLLPYGSLPANGGYMVYTSPATNPDCANNPTIKVTDCCGRTAQISLAINCYVGGTAIKIDGATYTGCSWQFGTTCIATGSYFCHNYNCDGTFVSGIDPPINAAIHTCDANGDCALNIFNEADCNAACAGGASQCPEFGCGPMAGKCVYAYGTHDVRTALMKAQGCCPINPLTGLPY